MRGHQWRGRLGNHRNVWQRKAGLAVQMDSVRERYSLARLHSMGTTRIDLSKLTEYFFAHAACARWGIENSLHWLLDVTFREDNSRVRKGYVAEKFNIVRQLAVNFLKKVL